jgi:hypothetical protein
MLNFLLTWSRTENFAEVWKSLWTPVSECNGHQLQLTFLGHWIGGDPKEKNESKPGQSAHGVYGEAALTMRSYDGNTFATFHFLCFWSSITALQCRTAIAFSWVPGDGIWTNKVGSGSPVQLAPRSVRT